MVTSQDAKARWDGYFYPGTTTLRNLLGVEDGKRWRVSVRLCTGSDLQVRLEPLGVGHR